MGLQRRSSNKMKVRRLCSRGAQFPGPSRPPLRLPTRPVRGPGPHLLIPAEGSPAAQRTDPPPWPRSWLLGQPSTLGASCRRQTLLHLGGGFRVQPGWQSCRDPRGCLALSGVPGPSWCWRRGGAPAKGGGCWVSARMEGNRMRNNTKLERDSMLEVRGFAEVLATFKFLVAAMSGFVYTVR